MIRTTATWLAALVVSAVAHGLFFLGLALTTKPAPVDPQAVPQTRLDMATYKVDRTDAQERAATARQADEARANPTSLGGAVVPTTRTGGEALPSADAAEVLAAAVSASVQLAPGTGASVAPVADPEPAPVELQQDGGTVLDATVIDAGRVQAVLAPAEVAQEEAAQSSELDATDAIADRVSSATPAAEPLVEAVERPDPVAANAANPTPVAALTDTSIPLEALADGGESVTAKPPSPTLAVLRAPSAVTVTVVSEPPVAVAQLAVASSGIRAEAIRPRVEALGTAPANSAALIPAAMPATRPKDQALPAAPVSEGSLSDQSSAPPVTTPEGEAATASLAWAGEDGEVDPISLAAIQAFMQPGDLAGSNASVGRVKDSIASILASVPCARLQTTFRPETGALELRGHIPEEDLRGPVLAALKAQVGGAIPVDDNILILPRPQCGALAGIGAVGLPQSTDQLTNPRVIGPDTHARVYEFSEGQRLTFDLVGPDYDALIYIDYYDADGMVLHLQPNEIIGLEEVPAEAVLVVGEERLDAPSLNITVAPPFGQEIMVAMAASHPLYDGLRPVREPAADYLRFMTEQVAKARELHADFKGEWVYFFVRTTPR